MTDAFDAAAITRRGWRQGSVLDASTACRAAELALPAVEIADDDVLLVMSHDCDIASHSLDKEPVVEILRARRLDARKTSKQNAWGRHPRYLEIEIDLPDPIILGCAIHERWLVPREWLAAASPVGQLDAKRRQVAAEWLAKRYLRAAFPGAFDDRWRSRMKEWIKLLRGHSESIQGVYLRLSTLDELPVGTPYSCELMIVTPESVRGGDGWEKRRETIESEVRAFWESFGSGILCEEVQVSGEDEITLLDISVYQRFDADWVSFEDDTPSSPLVSDSPV